MIILKAAINDNSVRGLIVIILVPGGARLYESSNMRTWYMITLVPAGVRL